MKGKNKNQDASLLFMLAGLALIIIVSLLDGFVFSFVYAIQHIISDLTVDIKVHAHIAGLVLLLYGIWRRYNSK